MKTTRNDHGFAAVEALLLVVIAAIIAGVGYWVFTQRKATNSETSNQSVNQVASKSETVKFATFLDKNTDEEEEAISAAANQLAETSLSDAAAVNNLGEAYNESSL